MRWLWGLFAGCMLAMVIGVASLGHLVWLLFVAPIIWLVLGSSIRCPRCRKHVMDNGRAYQAPWIPIPKTCVGCGRRKDDIWPFQYLLRPERAEG